MLIHQLRTPAHGMVPSSFSMCKRQLSRVMIKTIQRLKSLKLVLFHLECKVMRLGSHQRNVPSRYSICHHNLSDRDKTLEKSHYAKQLHRKGSTHSILTVFTTSSHSELWRLKRGLMGCSLEKTVLSSEPGGNCQSRPMT